MKYKIKLGLLLFLTCISPLTLSAEFKGVGAVKYSGFLDDEEKTQALIAAKLNALESWVYKEQKYHAPTYEKVKPALENDPDAYLFSTTQISDKKNSDNSTYQVVIRADINDVKLLNFLTQSGRDSANSSAEEQYITFVFVARELVAKTTKNQQIASQEKSQQQTISKDLTDNNATQGKSQIQTVAQTNSQTTFKDQLIWQASKTNEIDVAIGAAFSNANYLVVDAALLEEETMGQLDVNNFIFDYQHGNDVTPSTKIGAIRGLRSLLDPVQFLAMGTLDIDEYLQDETSGLVKVPVVVTAQVLAIQKRGAAVAKIGPVQYFGLGPTPIVAKNNALKQAAEEAAQALIAQLSAKSI